MKHCWEQSGFPAHPSPHPLALAIGKNATTENDFDGTLSGDNEQSGSCDATCREWL